MSLAAIVAIMVNNPHSWEPHLFAADTWPLDSQASKLIRLLYSVTNGCWGDTALHADIAAIYAEEYEFWLPTRAAPPHRVYDRSYFVLIPPGSFVMGPPGRRVPVTLTQGFWLGATTVTRRYWAAVMGDSATGRDNCRNSWDQYLPVTNVTYWEAVDFCSKMTTLLQQSDVWPAGWRCKLPTAAQWEYACRAGTITDYSFGEKPRADCMNYSALHSQNAGGTVFVSTSALQKNGWGLYCMHGNVWEMCEDYFVAAPCGGVDPVAPIGLPSEMRHLPYYEMRGGSFRSSARDCRSYIRGCANSGQTYDDVGFRIAVVQDL